MGAVGFMPAGISSCHLLNRLPTNRGSLFGSTCHTVQSNPCQTERLWGSGSAQHQCWWDAADWMNFLALGVWSAIYATPMGFNNNVFFFLSSGSAHIFTNPDTKELIFNFSNVFLNLHFFFYYFFTHLFYFLKYIFICIFYITFFPLTNENLQQTENVYNVIYP